LATERSALLVTAVRTGGVVLFPGVGSGTGLAAEAVFVRLPPLAGAVTVMVTFVPALAARSVRFVHTTLVPLKYPTALALTNVTLAGSASVTAILSAMDGPRLVTVMV